MSSSDDSSDSAWSRLTPSSEHKKETKLKPNKIINGNKKYYRQRFVDRWLERFKPWIAKHETDPEKSYCKVCKRFLSTRMYHLKRHERTTKHKSNLQSYLGANGLLPDRQNLGQRKKRKNAVKVSTNTDAGDSKFESIFMDTGKPISDEDSKPQNTLQDELPIKIKNMNHASASCRKDQDTTKQTKRKGKLSYKQDTRKGGTKLFLQIQKDRHELISSFNELLTAEKKDKDNVDLFFDSIISSVKALSPKLIVETKMRICQLICEMELRNIVENESTTQSPTIAPTILLSAPLNNEFIFEHQEDTASEGNQVGSSQNDPSHDVME